MALQDRFGKAEKDVQMQQMKDSGIVWVGEAPASWNTRALKNILTDRIGGCWGNDVSDETEGTICLRIADFDFDKGTFKNSDIKELTKRKYSFTQLAKYKLNLGDILVEKSGGGEKTPVGRCVIFDKTYVALFTNFMDRLRVDATLVIPFFVEYWLRSWYWCKSSPYYINQTIGIQNLNLTFMLSKEKIIYPTLEEQQNIVVRLNKECEKIDLLKADIHAQIVTLEQYKRSVITDAVTHGLNPSASLKDSGIAWVGMIPENWQVMPLYCFYTERKNINALGLEKNLLSLSYGKIIRKDINTNEGLLPSNYNGYNIVENNDVIIRPTDLQNDKNSLRTGLVKERGIITSAYIALKPKINTNSRYYHYLLHSYDIKKVFYNMGNGVRQGLNYNEFAKVMILVPSNVEQQKIVNYLDSKCIEIEQIIADKKAQLETLDEFKKSLIYEYVTGKKEVTFNE